MTDATPVERKGHVPVLKDEVLAAFETNFPGTYLDLTFGGGGHTRAILEAHPENKVVAIDCDPEAAARAEVLKAQFGVRFEFVSSFFNEIGSKVKGNFAGALMDLGVSSFQLDTAERGFSFRKEAPADMRMNPNAGVPAWKFIEQSDTQTLEMIVRDWAEEPAWREIVKDLEAAKGTPELRTTLGLAQIISNHARGRRNIHPATRVFMGLRMAVNQEIQRLEEALPLALGKLSMGGVLAVISFHSIEDRVVKNFYREATQGDNAPAELINKKVSRPKYKETRTNGRARSAKLRLMVKKLSPSTCESNAKTR